MHWVVSGSLLGYHHLYLVLYPHQIYSSWTLSLMWGRLSASSLTCSSFCNGRSCIFFVCDCLQSIVQPPAVLLSPFLGVDIILSFPLIHQSICNPWILRSLNFLFCQVFVYALFYCCFDILSSLLHSCFTIFWCNVQLPSSTSRLFEYHFSAVMFSTSLSFLLPLFSWTEISAQLFLIEL